MLSHRASGYSYIASFITNLIVAILHCGGACNCAHQAALTFGYAKEKAAHGHVVYALQEVPFWAPFDAVFDTSYPGNERCAVVIARPA
jgi:hypothetical protein